MEGGREGMQAERIVAFATTSNMPPSTTHLHQHLHQVLGLIGHHLPARRRECPGAGLDALNDVVH